MNRLNFRDRSMDASALSSAEYWISLIGVVKIVAAGLVALGVALEFAGDWASKPFERVVGAARRDEFIRLSTAAKEAEAKIKEAEAKIANAQNEAAQASQKAAEAELTLAQYRAGRSLTEEQKQELERVLKLAPKGPVIIKPNFLSPEPTRYANALSEIFNRAGFPNVGDRPLSVVSTNLPGIFVVIRDGDHRPLQLNAIAEAFNAAKIPFSVHAESYVPDLNTVVILVGERP